MRTIRSCCTEVEDSEIEDHCMLNRICVRIADHCPWCLQIRQIPKYWENEGVIGIYGAAPHGDSARSVVRYLLSLPK